MSELLPSGPAPEPHVRQAPAAPTEPPARPEPHTEQAGGLCVVRYGAMNHLGQFRCNLDPLPRVGGKVVIRTERGVELGEVVSILGQVEGPSQCRQCISAARLSEFIAASGPEYPFSRDGRVLRLANPQDIIDQRHLDSSAREEITFCRQQIREMKLDMKLVAVEHVLGGERIIFYFASEHRVDFRELVRRLAGQYRTRIEMRQVGARDEARLVADYERCGQRCCCQQFLKNLKPVSMRMAKTQKATLDPSKISGRCGRLMCCLRYEDEGYEDLRKKLPRKNIWVRTAGGVVGRVVDGQILTQLVKLMLLDGTFAAVPNEEITERNIEPPPMPQPSDRPSRPAQPLEKPKPRLLRDEMEAPSLADQAPVAVLAPQAGAPVEEAMPDGADLEANLDDEEDADVVEAGEDAMATTAPADARQGGDRQAQQQPRPRGQHGDPGGGKRKRRRPRRRRRGKKGGGPPGATPAPGGG